MLAATTTLIAWTAVALVFTVAVVGFAVYAIVRPFTHADYHRSSNKLFDPLD